MTTKPILHSPEAWEWEPEAGGLYWLPTDTLHVSLKTQAQKQSLVTKFYNQYTVCSYTADWKPCERDFSAGDQISQFNGMCSLRLI